MAIKQANILLVDDVPENISLIYQFLHSRNMTVLVAQDGYSALYITENEPIDLILLDVMMPEMDGFELCQRLKASEKSADIPVIFMTALGDTENKVRGFQVGGVDYLSKPVQEEELWARLQTHLRIHQLQNQLNEQNRQLQHAMQIQQAMLDNSLVGILLLDESRCVLQVNEQFCKLFACRRESIIGKTTEPLYPTYDDFIELGANAYPKLIDGEFYDTELIMRRFDDSRFVARIRGKAIVPGDLGYGSVWNLEDISAQKAAEDELRLSSIVFENAGEALMVCDQKARIVRINSAFTMLTGYESEEIIGKCPHVLNSGKHSDAFYRALWHDLLEKNQWQGELLDRRKDGHVFPVWSTINTVRRPNGEISHFVSVMRDITQHKEHEARLNYQANYDKLTGLPNRRLFQERLKKMLHSSRVHDKHFAILYIDLDGFKQVNDILGHDTGDEVLNMVAERLKAALRDHDVAARWGGDEFLVLLSEYQATEQVELVAGRLLEQLTFNVSAPGQDLPLSASIGVAFFPQDCQQQACEEDLIKRADEAMYQAKKSGKQRYCIASQGTNS